MARGGRQDPPLLRRLAAADRRQHLHPGLGPTAPRQAQGARLAGRLVVGATLIGLVAVVVTGIDGGRSPEGSSYPPPWPEKWVLWLGLLLFTLAVLAVVIRLRPRGHAGGRKAAPEEQPTAANPADRS